MSLRSRILVLCALTPLVASAAQPVELFTGYSLGMVQPDKDTNRAKFNGWNTSITAYPWSRLGLTADFAAFYGSLHPVTVVGDTDGSGGDTVVPASTRQYSFMAGPQFRLMRKERFETSVKALVGGAHAHALGDATLSETTVAAMFGSNFDFKLNRLVALRVSPGMYLTQFGPSGTQKNFRVSVGLVFRLGGGEE